MTKFYIDQHGCAKNQVDGEILISKLIDDGFEYVENSDDADVIIINSCGFIESAKKESLDAVYNTRAAYPKKKIILTGCLAERYAKLFKESLPEADGIFGNGDLLTISEFVKSVTGSKSKKKTLVQVSKQEGVCCYNRKHFMNFKNSAYVKITEGCSNHCTFCAIPLIRGELRSRPVKDVIAEIKALLKQGFFEINLIGQDLAAYGCGIEDKGKFGRKDWHTVMYQDLRKPLVDEKDFTSDNGPTPLYSLVEKISKIKGKFWVRLLYIHPDHFDTNVLELIKKDERILPYFDIPFQSGDDEIIHAMNRKGSFKSYAKLVRTIRKELPESCIRTTFLTGFPGEKEENAENTKKFLETIKSDWSGCFDYSKEDDTPAYKMKGQVAHRTAVARANDLSAIQHEITQSLLRKRVGKIYDVLVEEIVQNLEETDEGLAIGRAWFEAPEVDGNVVIRYDLDDRNAVKKIVPGAVVKVKAAASSEVDIDGFYVG